ncbi:MAG: D-alanine--D-alanine ligase family protein [Miltoncostaeaceae bacterium]
MSRPHRVAVLMGGQSSEHDVSLMSARAVIAALEATGHEVLPIVISRQGVWRVDDAVVTLARDADGRAICLGLDGSSRWDLDVVFPVLHGPNGEDGTVQGLLECAGVAYVGAGVAASALAMDKVLFKGVLRTAGIPTPDHVVVTAGDWAADPAAARVRVADGVGFPSFSKPARLGSSVGISRVTGPGELDAALVLALRHDPKVIVERGVVGGREIEVGVLAGDPAVASPVGEIGYDAEWYDYATKYEPGRMTLSVPADIPARAAERARELALRAFVAAECDGLARVDFFLCQDGTVVLSELNTMPGFTPTSVYAALMGAAGIAYDDLIVRLLALAVERADRRRAYLG